jgi:hypothetical protein
VRDAGDHCLLEHPFVLLPNPRAVRGRKGGANVQLDVVVPGELDRPLLQHLRAGGGELQHLLVAHGVQLPRRRHDARIRRQNAVDVRPDLDGIGAHGRTK